ncbi:MAG: NAD(P)-dependent oxidoreductase [Pseudomonadota bacterium]
MRIAVTGVTGTVGRAFAERAAMAGHSLVLLGRSAPEDLPATSDWVDFDLSTSNPLSKGALSEVDCAVHLAAKIDTNPANDADASALWGMNVLGTGRLIDELAGAGVPRFVMASSANIYDPSVEIADESTPIRPQTRTLYLSSKSAQEAYARELCRKHDIACAVLRISSIIDTGNDLVGKFLDMTLKGETITLANPEYGADFVSLDDVSQGLLLAAENSLADDFNLSSGERHTLEDIAHIIAKVCAVPVRINESGPNGLLDKGFPAIDCSKLSAQGYNPTALCDVIADMKAAFARNKPQSQRVAS